MNTALASVAQLVGAPSHTLEVVGWIPGQEKYLGCGSGPGWTRLRGNQSMFLSHINVSLPLSFSHPLSLKISEYVVE